MVNFEKTLKQARILSPLKNFEEDVISFEYRTNPLTGRNTTVINGMLGYIKRFLSTDETLLKSMLEQSRVNCPFCPENALQKTPMFPHDFLTEGRIIIGDAIVTPNLLGHAERSVLVILSKQHHLKLSEFTTETILNGFEGACVYLSRLAESDPSIRFPAFAFNYLPPAGSSIIHPHMQVLVRDRPFYLAKMLLECSRAYQEKTRSSYWSELILQEKDHERYLFEKNGVEWIVPFAPLRGLNEVHAIVRGKSNLLELSETNWSGLAEGMSRVLQFYHNERYVSFNAILVSGSMDEHLEYFDVNLRIISRPGIQSWCFTDAWALPYLLWDGEAVESPETLAGKIRAFLQNRQVSSTT